MCFFYLCQRIRTRRAHKSAGTKPRTIAYQQVCQGTAVRSLLTVGQRDSRVSYRLSIERDTAPVMAASSTSECQQTPFTHGIPSLLSLRPRHAALSICCK